VRPRRADDVVPIAQSRAYVRASVEAGGAASLIEAPGDHFTLIDPEHAAWAPVLAALPDLLVGR